MVVEWLLSGGRWCMGKGIERLHSSMLAYIRVIYFAEVQHFHGGNTSRTIFSARCLMPGQYMTMFGTSTQPMTMFGAYKLKNSGYFWL